MIKLSLEQVIPGIFTEQIPDYSCIYWLFSFRAPVLSKKVMSCSVTHFSPHIYKVSPSGSRWRDWFWYTHTTYKGWFKSKCHTMHHASRYINWNINICPNKLSIRIRNLIKFCWMIKKIWMFITWYKLDIALS